MSDLNQLIEKGERHLKHYCPVFDSCDCEKCAKARERFALHAEEMLAAAREALELRERTMNLAFIVADLREKLAAAERQRDEMAAGAEKAQVILQEAPELNFKNYNEDEVVELQDAALEAWKTLVGVAEAGTAILAARDWERDAALIDKLIANATRTPVLCNQRILSVHELRGLRDRALRGEL